MTHCLLSSQIKPIVAACHASHRIIAAYDFQGASLILATCFSFGSSSFVIIYLLLLVTSSSFPLFLLPFEALLISPLWLHSFLEVQVQTLELKTS